jgi:benzoate 4-monooxygenase
VICTGPNSLSFPGLSNFDAIYGFNKHIEKGDFYSSGCDNRQMENIFTSRTDASHREHGRKVVGPALSATNVASYELIISKNVSVLLSRVRAQLQDRSAIDVANIIHRYTFDTVVEVIYDGNRWVLNHTLTVRLAPGSSPPSVICPSLRRPRLSPCGSAS